MNDDLISRQAAIKAIEGNFCDPPFVHDAIAAIRELPSAQPDIGQCKDCKWWDNHDGGERCLYPGCGLMWAKPDAFCSFWED